MIFVGKTTDDDKNSVFLFCRRDHLQNVTEQPKDSVQNNNDDVNNSKEHHKDGAEKITTHEENTKNDKDITYEKNTTQDENPTYDENTSLDEYFFNNLDECNETHIWDDYDCFKISQEDFFPSNVMQLNTQKIVITRFLNFYVGGKLPKGLSVSDVLFAVISIIPLTGDNEEFIWYKNEYRENGTLFFLTPEEKLSFEFKNIQSKKKKTNDKQNEKIKSTISSKSDRRKENVKKSIKDGNVIAADSETVPKSHYEKNNKDVDIANDSKTLPEIDKSINIKDLIINETIQWYGKFSYNENKTVDKLPDFGPAQNSAFNISCNKVLDTWDVNAESRIILKYFLGIVALTLMKAIAKGKNNLMNTFSGVNFRNKIKFIDNIINYTRPNESCITKCCREFKIRERCHQVMFAKVLFNAFRVDYMCSNDLINPWYGLYNIFRMCIVDHLVYYDMGIINLLKSIYKHIRDCGPFSIIIEDLQSDDIEECLKQVRYFITHYMIKTKGNTLTHHWARFFDDKQFEYLSCDNSYATAVVLAVFVENMTRNAEVWRSGWVKTQEEDLSKYKELGNILYNEYKIKSEAKAEKLCIQFTSLLNSM